MSVHHEDFPYEEIRADDGNYFDSADEAMNRLCCNEENIWSVAEEDGVFTYGPSHHRINVIGWIGTDEPHDGDTYFVERT